ncbi:MAG TPA: fibronectin type III domain-containing protein [Solirubrobacterales bacterium]|nr:fibronectin type III domain-containing protein [Solirubrobacterales bacterium]
MTAVTPSAGPDTGGTTVTVEGSGFAGATGVSFGSTAARGFQVDSTGDLTAVAPDHSDGTVDVTVAGPAGTSAVVGTDHFTFQPPTGPSPVAGLTATGTTDNSITLNWTAPVGNEITGVTIRRSTGSSPPSTPTSGEPVAEVGGSTTTFTDTGLSPGTTYSYSVFAHDAAPRYASPATATTTTPCNFDGVVHVSGTLARDTTWSPACGGTYVIDSTVVIPAGVTLRVDPGTKVDADGVGPALRVSGILDGTGSEADPIAADSTATSEPSWSLEVEPGATARLAYADLTGAQIYGSCSYDSSPDCAATTTIDLDHDALKESSLTAIEGTASEDDQHIDVEVTDDDLDRTTLDLEGLDRPVVTGNYLHDSTGSWALDQPAVHLYAVQDLHGFHDNRADPAMPAVQRTLDLEEDGVATTWSPDPDSDGAIFAMFGTTVDAGATMTLPPDSTSYVWGSLTVKDGGTLAAATSAAQRATATDLCVLGNAEKWVTEYNCSTGDTPTSWQLNLEPGATADLSYVDLTDAQISGSCSYGQSSACVATTTVDFDHDDLGRSGLEAVQGTPQGTGDNHLDLTLTNNDLDRTTLDLEGLDRPVVTGNYLHDSSGEWDLDQPAVHLWGIEDLHGFHDNRADPGMPAVQRTWDLQEDTVATTWGPDPGSDGAITSLIDDTVQEGATMTLPPDTTTYFHDLTVKEGGTVTADATAAERTTMTSLCVLGEAEAWFNEYNCPTDGSPPVWPFAIEPGATVDLADVNIEDAQIDGSCSYAYNPACVSNTKIHLDHDDLETSSLGVIQGNPEGEGHRIDVDLTDNDLDRTTLDLENLGSPVVTGNYLHDSSGEWGLDQPAVHLWGIGDLHGFHDNRADPTLPAVERTWDLQEDTVATTWGPDPDSSGAIFSLMDITVEKGATMTLSADSTSYFGGISVKKGGTLDSGSSAADPATATSICVLGDAEKWFNELNCPSAPLPASWSLELEPGSTADLSYVELTDAQIDASCSYFSLACTDTTKVDLDHDDLTTGSLTAIEGIIDDEGHVEVKLTDDDFTETPVDLLGGSPEVSDCAWTDTPSPLTANDAEDLAGIADDNTTFGVGEPDHTFTISGSVGKGKTLRLAPATDVLYQSEGITVEGGGELVTDPDASVSGGDVTIDAGGSAVIGESVWTGGQTTFEVDGEGNLELSGATIEGSGTGIAAKPGAEVTVGDGSRFSGITGAAIEANADREEDEPGTASVTVSGSSFEGNGFNISNCDTEGPVPCERVEATGNSGLSEANVSTHTDTCVWTYPPGPDGEPTPPPDGKATYPRDPIWDVEIGISDAPPCTAFYDNEPG